VLGDDPDPALQRIVDRTHAATEVEYRHLTLPFDDYWKLGDFTAANDVFIEHAPRLAAEAVGVALERAGLSASDVDVIAAATVTGVSVPTLDARLVPILGLRQDVKRLPLVGLGCVAGATGLARVSELVRADPNSVAVLVATELCSLTIQHDDTSMANIVSAGLFGDGAAAVVIVGDARADSLGINGVQIKDSASFLFPDTERVMGWDVGSYGLRVVLAPTVPEIVSHDLRPLVEKFLAKHDLQLSDVKYWVAHPGGPKVLRALESALELDPSATALTWDSLRDVGNLSSASVLHVLDKRLSQTDLPPGPGLAIAMGPGFCAELVLLQW
jgi:alkylresorcinol/alkylpyrone synthase